MTATTIRTTRIGTTIAAILPIFFAWAFAAATSIYCYHKRAGIVVGVIAIIIGFSRLYLFVHFPTDVLIGAVMGIVLAIICAMGINRISDKMVSF